MYYKGTGLLIALFMIFAATWPQAAQAQPACINFRVTQTPGGFSINPSINFDGTRIAFESGVVRDSVQITDISLFDTTTRILTGITTGGVSRNADFGIGLIAFDSTGDFTGSNADGNREIFLFDENTRTIRQITDTPSGVVNFTPSIIRGIVGVPPGTPPRLPIAFLSNGNFTGENADGNLEVFRLDSPDTGEFTQVTKTTGQGVGGFGPPSINISGSRIAFLSVHNLTGENPDGNLEVFLFDAATGIKQITHTEGDINFNPSINSDGTRIAFDSTGDFTGSNADGNREIFLFDANTGIVQITDTMAGETPFAGANFGPSLNSDGTRLAFSSNRDLTLTGKNVDGNHEIFLFDTRTRQFTQVTDTRDTFNQSASINSDGTRVAFLSSFGENHEIFLARCGLCLFEERRDLNSLNPTQRRELSDLLVQYLTGPIVGEHRRNLRAWHFPGNQFFPGHRGYISGFEMWLLNVASPPRPEFVPLPKWNPRNPIPSEFRPTDTEACRTSDPPRGSDCSGIRNFNINRPLPANFVFSGPPPTTSGLCAYADVRQLQVGVGGRPPGLELDYHNGVHGAVGGTMGQVPVASAALVFWPWHAFIDDVGLQYERVCRGSAPPTCAGVFTRTRPVGPQVTGFGSSDTSAKGPAHVTAPLGFWWWFEDVVVPPEVSPGVVVDHSGFNFEGEVRGGAKLVPGLVGQALQLDGQDDFVEVRDPTVGEVDASDFTLDAWVKTTAGRVQPVVDKWNGLGYTLFLEDGLLGLSLGTKRAQRVFMAQDGRVADGQWHHVAAVVNRHEAEASALFVDGEVVLEFDATALADDATSHSRLWIGRSRALYHSAFFEGELDEIDLFRSALSRDLVASIYG